MIKHTTYCQIMYCPIMLTLANLISDFGKNTANSSTTTKHFSPKQVGVDYG
jgi:hypothetical protein